MDTKKCTGCKENKPVSEFSKNNKSRDGIGYYCRQCRCNQKSAWWKRWKSKNPEKYRQKILSEIRSNRLKRQKVLDYYGGKCACCGESRFEFLAIDHINGGGNKHTKERNREKLDMWIIRNNFPPGFRILCNNCNQSIGAYGYCPHSLEQSQCVA